MTERMSDDAWLEHVREKLKSTGAPSRRDDHHVFNYSREWNLREQGAYIRENVIAHGIHRAVHNLIHAECPPVPVPQYHTLARVARELPKGLPVLDGIDTYCSLVEESNHHPRITPIEIELNRLSIEALRLQIPFIRDGIRSTR